jgi:hypothetical protein
MSVAILHHSRTNSGQARQKHASHKYQTTRSKWLATKSGVYEPARRATGIPEDLADRHCFVVADLTPPGEKQWLCGEVARQRLTGATVR